MPRALEQFGLSIAGNAANTLTGALLGQIFAKSNDRRQIRQQQKLTDMQAHADRQMSEFNRMQQMKMWEDTNYSAQVKQLEKAGLNPAMIYGMGGAGGATAQSSPGQVHGANAPSGGGEQIAMASTMAQMGLMRAQTENINAQTEKTKAETAKTTGVDTREAETRIQQMGQGIENAKAANELLQVQTRIAELEEQFSSESIEDRLTVAQWQWRKIVEEVRKIAIDSDLTEATTESQIQIARQKVLEVTLGNKLLAQELVNNDRIQNREDLKFELTKWKEEKNYELEISDRTVNNIWKVLERIIPGTRKSK